MAPVLIGEQPKTYTRTSNRIQLHHKIKTWNALSLSAESLLAIPLIFQTFTYHVVIVFFLPISISLLLRYMRVLPSCYSCIP